MPFFLYEKELKEMEKKLNTTYDFEFCDGSKAVLTLAFYALYQLRSKNKTLYDRYNKVMNKQQKGELDELDSITILYTAYHCANLNSTEELLTEEDFIFKCGSDRVAINNAIQHLVNPKKQ